MIDVKTTLNSIIVNAPFHPQYPPLAQIIGGTYSSPNWVFPITSKDAVATLNRDIYGYQKSNLDTDNISVTINSALFISHWQHAFYLAGRQIARITDDLGIELGEGVTVKSGSFQQPEGTETIIALTQNGAEVVFQVEGVYQSAIHNIKNMYGWCEQIKSVEILFPAVNDELKEISLVRSEVLKQVQQYVNTGNPHVSADLSKTLLPTNKRIYAALVLEDLAIDLTATTPIESATKAMLNYALLIQGIDEPLNAVRNS
jgi:hypothetical protein